MQDVERETCAAENDVNMNAEDDGGQELFAEEERGCSISLMYEWNILDAERERDRK